MSSISIFAGCVWWGRQVLISCVRHGSAVVYRTTSASLRVSPRFRPVDRSDSDAKIIDDTRLPMTASSSRCCSSATSRHAGAVY